MRELSAAADREQRALFDAMRADLQLVTRVCTVPRAHADSGLSETNAELSRSSEGVKQLAAASTSATELREVSATLDTCTSRASEASRAYGEATLAVTALLARFV